jgi:hypothetical protein
MNVTREWLELAKNTIALDYSPPTVKKIRGRAVESSDDVRLE